MARHLQELALFVLPRKYEDFDSDQQGSNVESSSSLVLNESASVVEADQQSNDTENAFNQWEMDLISDSAPTVDAGYYISTIGSDTESMDSRLVDGTKGTRKLRTEEGQQLPQYPADQNQPCNAPYVGNILCVGDLPIDASEEKLRDIFSKQKGYKRLIFRTKANGPECFVEFEDVAFATKALAELDGRRLRHVKGGMQLTFSNDPSSVHTGQPEDNSHTFATQSRQPRPTVFEANRQSSSDSGTDHEYDSHYEKYGYTYGTGPVPCLKYETPARY
ncbi:MAG: hypothetical protein Q9213_002291 [Squamulea squamosa]